LYLFLLSRVGSPSTWKTKKIVNVHKTGSRIFTTNGAVAIAVKCRKNPWTVIVHVPGGFRYDISDAQAGSCISVFMVKKSPLQSI
jgi:hypothetical protein